MRFGTWNVRSLYRAGTLGLVTSKIDKYRMDLVGVQEVRWEGSGTLQSRNYTLFYVEGNTNHQPGIWSAVKKVEFISDRVPCITLKGSAMVKILQQCNLIVWDECTMAHKKIFGGIRQNYETSTVNASG